MLIRGSPYRSVMSSKPHPKIETFKPNYLANMKLYSLVTKQDLVQINYTNTSVRLVYNLLKSIIETSLLKMLLAVYEVTCSGFVGTLLETKHIN